MNVQDPARVQRSTLEIAAAWLAGVLEPDRVWFYRQSDVPETTELTWLLTCVAGKGLLNRAHAYKAAVDRNRETGEDDDAGVTAGLFMRSEEHTSELQSLMRISYAVFCLKKKMPRT